MYMFSCNYFVYMLYSFGIFFNSILTNTCFFFPLFSFCMHDELPMHLDKCTNLLDNQVNINPFLVCVIFIFLFYMGPGLTPLQPNTHMCMNTITHMQKYVHTHKHECVHAIHRHTFAYSYKCISLHAHTHTQLFSSKTLKWIFLTLAEYMYYHFV